MNKLSLVGRLTRDPDVRVSKNGTTICQITVAEGGSKYTDKNGNERKITPLFIDCVLFGSRANVVAKYFQKGSPIILSGRLQTDTWEAKDGGKRSKITLRIDDFEFVPANKRSSGERTQTIARNDDFDVDFSSFDDTGDTVNNFVEEAKPSTKKAPTQQKIESPDQEFEDFNFDFDEPESKTSDDEPVKVETPKKTAVTVPPTQEDRSLDLDESIDLSDLNW